MGMIGARFMTLLALAAPTSALTALAHHAGPRPRLQAAACRAERSRNPVLQENRPRPTPFLENEVPATQQPVVELRELRAEPFFGWAESDEYLKKVLRLLAAFSLLLGLPISLVTYDDQPRQLLQAILAAVIGGSLPTLGFVLRLRAGWGFVSGRLTAPSTYFEVNERGFEKEKDAETRLRDRYMNEYEVLPAMRRVDRSFAITAAVLATSFIGLQAVTDFADPYEQYSSSYLSKLQSDDALAEREARRGEQRLKPAYCDSRYYTAIAGGESNGSCD